MATLSDSITSENTQTADSIQVQSESSTEIPTQAPEASTATSSQGSEPKRIVSLPSTALKQVRDQARKQGQKAFAAQLDKQARSLGYASHAALLEAADRKAKRNKPSPTPVSRLSEDALGEEDSEIESEDESTPQVTRAPQTMSERKELERLRKQNARLLEEKRSANRARAHEEKRRREAERAKDALEVEHTLRLVAHQSGIRTEADIDYALHQLRNRMSTRSEAELKNFDERKFFGEELRKTHPYLYGVQSTPAHTSSPASAPTPKRAEPPVDSNRDALKMSTEAYHARLRDLGLSPPSAGSPL